MLQRGSCFGQGTPSPIRKPLSKALHSLSLISNFTLIFWLVCSGFCRQNSHQIHAWSKHHFTWGGLPQRRRKISLRRRNRKIVWSATKCVNSCGNSPVCTDLTPQHRLDRPLLCPLVATKSIYRWQQRTSWRLDQDRNDACVKQAFLDQCNSQTNQDNLNAVKTINDNNCTSQLDKDSGNE